MQMFNSHHLPGTVAETWRRVWGGQKICLRTKNNIFFRKISIFRAKISYDHFLVIDQVFQIFPFTSQIFRIFTMLNVVYDPFLTRKTPFLLCSYFRAQPRTLLLKILGGRMHGPSPPPQILGDRPQSP